MSNLTVFDDLKILAKKMERKEVTVNQALEECNKMADYYNDPQIAPIFCGFMQYINNKWKADEIR